MSRVTISLKNEERAALVALSEREGRDPRAQAALLIRTELHRLGLLAHESLPAPAATAARLEDSKDDNKN